MSGCGEGEGSAVAGVVLLTGDVELELYAACLIRCKIVNLWQWN